MTSPAKLLRHYNTRLMAHESVRALVVSVRVVGSGDAIDYGASVRTVRAAAHGLTGADLVEARHEIMGYLSDVYFTSIHDTIDESWWWEMHVRLEKLLVVSMILEGDHVRSTGVSNPDARHIPQALVGLYERIRNLKRDTFPALRERFARRTEALLRDAASAPFMQCYTVRPQ